MTDETPQRKAMGRPRIYQEPRQRLTLELPQSLIAEMDDRANGQTRTAWIESAIREKLARER